MIFLLELSVFSQSDAPVGMIFLVLCIIWVMLLVSFEEVFEEVQLFQILPALKVFQNYML